MVHGYDEFYLGLELYLIPYTRFLSGNTQRARENKIESYLNSFLLVWTLVGLWSTG